MGKHCPYIVHCAVALVCYQTRFVKVQANIGSDTLLLYVLQRKVVLMLYYLLMKYKYSVARQNQVNGR